MSKVNFDVDDSEYIVYAYVDPNPVNGEYQVVYIGSDSNGQNHTRDREHRKPSKRITKMVPIKGEQVLRKPQLINVRIEDEGLLYGVLARVADKETMYICETELIRKHLPKYNEKKAGWTPGANDHLRENEGDN